MHIDIDEAPVGRLRARLTRANTTMFAGLHAAVAITVNRLGGGDDLVLGSPAGGRTDPALAGTVGYLVNTLPVRHRLRATDTVGDVLSRTRAAVLGALEHQAVPFDRIVAEVGSTYVPGANPPAQILLAYTSVGHHTGDDAVTRSGLRALPPIGGSLDVAKTDLDPFFTDDGHGLAATLAYSTALFDPPTIEQFASTLVEVLQAIADGTESTVAELRIDAVHDSIVRDGQRAPATTANGKVDRGALPLVTPSVDTGVGRELRSDTERDVAELVRDVLGIDGAQLSALDDFFALGGHSFTAVRLVSRIADRFGVRVGVRDVFEASTIAGLAAVVSSSTERVEADSSESLREAARLELRLAPEDVSGHLICVYPASGSAVMYERLLEHVPPQMSVHGLQSLALVDPERDLGDLEATARWYLPLVEDLVDGVPIHLLGWSYGAHLAFTLARLLRDEAGLQVSSLTLLDSGPTTVGRAELPEMSSAESVADFCYAFDLDAAGVTSEEQLVRRAVHDQPLWPGITESDVRGILAAGSTATAHLAQPPTGTVAADALLLMAQVDGNPYTYDWAEFVTGDIVRSTTPKGHREMLDDEVVAHWAPNSPAS